MRWRLNSKKALARAGAVALGRQAHWQGGRMVWARLALSRGARTAACAKCWGATVRHQESEPARPAGFGHGQLPTRGPSSPRPQSALPAAFKGTRADPGGAAPPPSLLAACPCSPPRVRPGVPGAPRPERRAPMLARPCALGPRGASRAGTPPAARRPARVPGQQVPVPLT